MAKKKQTEDDDPTQKSLIQQELKWLLLDYEPVSLFSLRMTHATSKGGKTLLVPTPYAFKLALIDACFRCYPAASSLSEAKRIFDSIKAQRIRFSPPTNCIVQNTFVKIRQESREADNGFYDSTIAYREWCFHQGILRVAITLDGLDDFRVHELEHVACHVNQIGKRGCFWQFQGTSQYDGFLPNGFTRQPTDPGTLNIGMYGVSQFLDDFGPKLCAAKDGFDRISSYMPNAKIVLGEHRILTPTFIPYVRVRATRGYTQYYRKDSTAIEIQAI